MFLWIVFWGDVFLRQPEAEITGSAPGLSLMALKQAELQLEAREAGRRGPGKNSIYGSCLMMFDDFFTQKNKQGQFFSESFKLQFCFGEVGIHQEVMQLRQQIQQAEARWLCIFFVACVFFVEIWKI